MILSPQVIVALINLGAQAALDTAVIIMQNLGKQATVDDAINALKTSANKTAADYLAEANAAMLANQPPTTPVTPPATP